MAFGRDQGDRTISDSNRIELAYKVETTWGTEESGTYRALPITSESLKADTGTQRSAGIRSDRQTPAVLRNALSASGSIDGELVYGGSTDIGFDEFFQQALQSAVWTASPASLTASDLTAADTENKITDPAAGSLDAFSAGDWVKITGFTGGWASAMPAYARVASGSDAENLILEGVDVVDNASGDSVTILQGAHITNGTTQGQMTIEKRFADLSGPEVFLLYRGMTVQGFRLSVESGGIAQVSFQLLGKDEDHNSSSAHDPYTAAPTVDPFTGVDGVKGFLENSVTFAVTAYELNVENNLRQREQIGTLGPVSIGAGTFDVNGSFKAYMDNATAVTALIDKYHDQTVTELAMQFRDSTSGASYVFDTPQVKITDLQVLATGQNEDVLVEASFEAYRDPTYTHTLRIARWDS